MELAEIHEPFFSKWVEKKENRSYKTRKNISEDDIENGLQNWLSKPNKNLDAKLKVIVRQGMDSMFRAQLWSIVSGGEARLHSNPQYYQEVINDLGLQIPSKLPNNIFSINQSKSRTHLLSPGGEEAASKILYVISQVHPDVQFCPLLPPITCLCLHFMDVDEAFCCISSMMDSKMSYFDQSQTEILVMAKTFQDCLKAFMRKPYKFFKRFIAASRHIEVTKGTVFFPLWISWIFDNLDFWTLVYITDNFYIQGSKVLVRVGLILFGQFSKWLTGNQIQSGDVEGLFKQFISESNQRGYKLMEAAFKIRGLSTSKLAALRAKNMGLLKDGVLEIPFTKDTVKVPTLNSIQGTDMLTGNQWELISSWLPEKIQIKHPYCLFSTQNDGFSISTLYNKCENENETILLMKTTKDEILGAYCSSPWSERLEVPKTLCYFGTGETFVFSVYPNSQMYPWNSSDDGSEGRTDFFMAGDKTCLLVGGGGDNALWIDGELHHGHSGSSKTFSNQPLTSEKDFEVIRVEVLGFKS